MNKSFLKWAGGKSRTLPALLPVFNKYRDIFVEPFCGSGVVSLNTDYRTYIMSDINKDLIDTFKTLQIEKEYFIDYCFSFFLDGNDRDRYYQLRETFNQTNDPKKKSALFVYLNRHCFNGLCRYNKDGRFNVPFGKYKKVYFPRKEMEYFIEKSKNIIFHCEDYAETINRVDGLSAMIYIDPPYVPLSKTSSFVNYSKEGFSWFEHKRLREYIDKINNPVVLSNSISAKDLYKEYDCIEIESPRYIGSKVNSRKSVKEIIVVKK